MKKESMNYAISDPSKADDSRGNSKLCYRKPLLGEETLGVEPKTVAEDERRQGTYCTKRNAV